MELLWILLGLIALVVGFFCLGAITKFLWGWLPLVLGLLVALSSALSR